MIFVITITLFVYFEWGYGVREILNSISEVDLLSHVLAFSMKICGESIVFSTKMRNGTGQISIDF